MGLNEMLLICAALLPAIALCIYVFKKDRVEKEPVGLLLSLLFLGAVICFPAAEIETVLCEAIDSIFLPLGVEMGGDILLDNTTYHIYNVCQNFIGIALVEEGLKFVVLFFRTSKNKNFNSLFDGIIYAVFVSLGFAALENIFYVLEYGWLNALTRGILSVPGHMFFAVLMGYYYSLYHMYEMAGKTERSLKSEGLIAKNAVEFSGKRFLVMSLIMPVLAHGLYDYCCTVDSVWATLGLYAFVLFLYIYCFGKIKKVSKEDTDDVTFSNAMVRKKYPQFSDRL